MAPEDQAPPDNQQDKKAAGGGPAGMGYVTYAEAAERLLDNGYAPLPIRPGTKRPPIVQWTTLPIETAQVARWIRQYPDHGVGLRTGRLVAVDIDFENPDLAHAAGQRVEDRLGATLMRVGRWPKRLFLYRAATPFPGFGVHKCDLLALGQQLVGFGIHPDTGRPYHWPLDDTPLDVALEDLPTVGERACRSLLAELAQLHPHPEPRARKARKGGQGPRAPSQTRDGFGRFSDGRDGWLSTIAYHAVHDALDAGGPIDAIQIAGVAWRRFEETTDLERPKQDGREHYGPEDAARKVADKLRLLRAGRLPSRAQEQVEAPDLPAAHPAEEARAKLDAVLADACTRVEEWHAGKAVGAAPQIGVKATVGLGKSSAARRRLIPLRQRLETAGAPSRLLILTPSLALADETADAWREAGERVAVLRGYQANHRTLRRPMCANLPAVLAAMEAGEDVQTTACRSASGNRCAQLEGCLKQANRTEVADADVVVAAYDALFTGFAIQHDSVGLIVIDEGCWQRAHEALSGLAVETFAYEHLSVQTRSRKPESFDAAADLHALRLRAVAAFEASGEGPLRRQHLVTAGLTVADAQLAGQLERRRVRSPGLYPGMPQKAMRDAMRQVEVNARSRLYIACWEAIGKLLVGSAVADGRIEIGPPDGKTGKHPVTARRPKSIHMNLRGKPVLHLDATLRPELARTVLPELEVTEITAEAPHMHLRLITGPFGKGSLCDIPRVEEAERTRRANRLRECADYARWHARRFARTLVITYKDIEDAFAGIPGVEVAHFNAVAGLDVYRDIELLIVIGRPLPSSGDLGQLSGALFGHVPGGRYKRELKGVHMRSGPARRVRATVHTDSTAEVLRAAICDDELIQAIGRGRAVNRTASDPLEVHVLADVVVPLVHDRLCCWEIDVPDVVQRMLLVGLAVDSPEHAVLLHPQLFVSVEAAKKAFQREGFRGQTPIRDPYREMSLKSASYRRPGRGRSWQRCYWIAGTESDAKAALERAIGPLAGWRPD